MLNRPRRGFERNDAVVESGESAIPVAPPLHRGAQADSRLLTLKPPIVLRFEELPFYSGGTHFERIAAAGYNVFDIQDSAHLLGDQLAIAMRDTFGFVDRDADKPVRPAALDFDLDQFHAFRLGHAVCDFFDFGSHLFLHVTKS